MKKVICSLICLMLLSIVTAPQLRASSSEAYQWMSIVRSTESMIQQYQREQFRQEQQQERMRMQKEREVLSLERQRLRNERERLRLERERIAIDQQIQNYQTR